MCTVLLVKLIILFFFLILFCAGYNWLHVEGNISNLDHNNKVSIHPMDYEETVEVLLFGDCCRRHIAKEVKLMTF